jgi:hypothetical protein
VGPVTTPRGEQDCIAVAAIFMAAEPGAVQRVLTAHRKQPDGWYSGCICRPVRWPCPTAHIALQAERLQGPSDHDR